MQRHCLSTKRSANKNLVPSGISASKYDTHTPSANSGNCEHSPATPKENLAPSRDIRHSIFCPSLSSATIETLKSFGEVRQITAGDPADSVALEASTCNCADVFRQASKIQNATPEEISVMHLVFLIGLADAKTLAAKLRLKVRPALQALLTARDEPGRRYTKRRTKKRSQLDTGGAHSQ